MIGSREFTAGVLTSAMFLAGCSVESGGRQREGRLNPPPAVAPFDSACGLLKNVEFPPPSEGVQRAINKGECAGIYNPETYRAVGQIASGDVVTVVCAGGPKPLSLRVEANGVGGNVSLGGRAVQQYKEYNTKEHGYPIPDCPVASPSSSAS